MPASSEHHRTDIQAQGDRDLALKLLAEHDVRRAIERVEKLSSKTRARRHLLATATRLTPEMAPDLHRTLDHCRTTLGIDDPIEAFVYPEPRFNAAAVRPDRGRLLVMFSSSLLEAFDPVELAFVTGHELGHYLFEHHKIPVGMLLTPQAHILPALALRLFAWQRYAEISSDRAGMICSGDLDSAARALFKLSSGLAGDRVTVRIDQFLKQVGDLQEETENNVSADDAPRGDWFATHPFSPLRLKAASLFAASELMQTGGSARATLEDQVQQLMSLMNPSYLQGRSEVAEIMRRLLFAGGVAVAAATGEPTAEGIEALEKLLGAGSIPRDLKPEAIIADLSGRIEAVKEKVPRLRRAQVLRDLCVIARADGTVAEAERRVLLDIAAQVDVEATVVDCGLDPDADECPGGRLED